MNVFTRTKQWFAGFFAVGVAILLFLFPHQAVAGVQQGLNRCYNSVIPALFPFFILSDLFLQSPFCLLCNWLFRPFTAALRIPRSQSGLLLVGWIGGFAACGVCIGNAVKSDTLSNKQAAFFLIPCCAAGPSFVVGAVGCLMLGSLRIGICLYLAQLCACLVCGVLCSFFLSDSQPPLSNPCAMCHSFTEILSGAVYSVLTVCGYVVFFQILYQFVCQSSFSWASACLLEMTLGCSESASLGAFRIFAAACSISLLGICAFLQIGSFTRGSVSLLPLLASRLLHLPLMLGFTYLFLRFWNQQSTVWASSSQKLIIHFRMPCDAALIFFLFAVSVCASCRFAFSRQNSKV